MNIVLRMVGASRFFGRLREEYIINLLSVFFLSHRLKQETVVKFIVIVALSFSFLALALQGSNAFAQRLNVSSATTTSLDTASRISGDWASGVFFHTREEGVDNANISGIFLRTRPRLYVVKMLDFSGEFRMLFRNGRQQSTRLERWDSSFLSVREALVNFRPFSITEFSAGLVGQRYLKTPLLLDPKYAFAGVREKVGHLFNKWQLEFVAQQSIPGSTTLGVDRSEKERLPSLFSETFSLKFLPTSNLNFLLQTTLFQFNDLPSAVAFQSAGYGNQVNGDYAANSSFFYDFHGHVVKLEGFWSIVPALEMSLGSYVIQNRKAEDAADMGQHSYLKVDVTLGETVITPRYGVYFIESDASVATYAEDRFGGTNRSGYIAGVEVSFRDLGFKLASHYIHSEPINQHPDQQDINDLYLGVETLHVDF